MFSVVQLAAAFEWRNPKNYNVSLPPSSFLIRVFAVLFAEIGCKLSVGRFRTLRYSTAVELRSAKIAFRAAIRKYSSVTVASTVADVVSLLVTRGSTAELKMARCLPPRRRRPPGLPCRGSAAARVLWTPTPCPASPPFAAAPHHRVAALGDGGLTAGRRHSAAAAAAAGWPGRDVGAFWASGVDWAELMWPHAGPRDASSRLPWARILPHVSDPTVYLAPGVDGK